MKRLFSLNKGKAPKTAPIKGSAHDAVIHDRAADHISYCAVSLEWLVEEFMPQHPQIVSKKMMTRDVVKSIVKPACTNESYVQMLHRTRGSDTDTISRGRPFFYLSHSWERPFTELVGMLQEHFSVEEQARWRRGEEPLPWEEVYVWLDVLAMNQHTPKDMDFNTRWALLLALREMVQDAVQTLMVLDCDGDVLDRLWCLYDAWQAGRKGKGSLLLLAYGVDDKQLRRAEKLFSWALQSRKRLNSRGELMTADSRASTSGSEGGLNRLLNHNVHVGGADGPLSERNLMDAQFGKMVGHDDDPSTLADVVHNLTKLLHHQEKTEKEEVQLFGRQMGRSRRARRVASRLSNRLPVAGDEVLDMTSVPHEFSEEEDEYGDGLGGDHLGPPGRGHRPVSRTKTPHA